MADDQTEAFKKDTRPPVDISREKALYLVAYAHLDTQWRWAYPQVIREFIGDTLHRNFALIEKYPNYIFNFSGSRRYEMMKEYYPAEYEKLKGVIAGGQWFPCGSSVDEGDAVVPSLESMVRHVLYGNRYFQREFGVSSHEFMLPDCFGFPASLPSVLAHCGIKGFSTQKLTWGSANGIPFKVGTWTGPDGASILAALDPGSYTGSLNEDLSQNATWQERNQKTGEASGAFVDYHYYGTGDKGGAPTEKSVQWAERSVAGKGPLRVMSSKADAMFDQITPGQKAKLPNYKGELLLTNHSAGSITSQAYMKRWNRKSELLADAAERASVTACWLGGLPYPAKKLYDAWDLVLGSQMHDMLPGTSLPKAYEFCWNDFILAQNQFAAVETEAAAAVVSALDTRAKGVSVVVYNPLSIQRDDVVEADVTFPETAPQAVRVLGPDGKDTPAQVDHRNGATAHIVFLAHVPAVGFACYDVQTCSGESASALKVCEPARSLENARYRVTVNEAGDIASIFDKITSKELLAAPARLSFQYENPKQYPAWNMDWEDRAKPSRAYVDGPSTVRIVENGPARVALEIDRMAQGSRFVQQIRLAAGEAGDLVEVVNKIDWMTRESSLKASFPLAVSNTAATYSDKIGTVSRGNNEPKRFEVPQQSWFDLTDNSGRYGVAILNDSKFGSDKSDDRTVRLTLLYTPGTQGKYEDQGCQDFGRHDITYAIAGHTGDWKQSGVPWLGARVNQRLVAFSANAHPGKLGKAFGFLKVDGQQVEVVAIKKAEDNGDIVIRLRELTGGTAKGIRLSFASKIVEAREVDGQEHAIGAALSLQDGELVADFPGYGVRAFALKLALGEAKTAAPISRPVQLAYDLDALSGDANRAGGAFDSEGRTYPAEQMPAEIASEGISFKMGSVKEDKKNAVVCRGQSVQLPSGGFDRVYLLAAAVDGDTFGTVALGGAKLRWSVQNWSGYIGQWDTRLWKGVVPELAFNWNNDLEGVTPGFTKRDTVAWYASHRHHPTLGNEYYQYCYLFKYGFDLPAGATAITLPDNEKIRVFAITAAKAGHDDVDALQPLYDTLADHVASAPYFTPATGKFNDITRVRIACLYGKTGGLHFTRDGSEPTAASTVYSEPLILDRPATIKARMILPDGKLGPVTAANYEVNDVIAPVVTSVQSMVSATQVCVEFSEPVTAASAESTVNYQFEPRTPVTAAKLSPDGRCVKLGLTEAVGSGAALTVRGVSDRSPGANRIVEKSIPVMAIKQVFTLAAMDCDGKSSKRLKVAGLPRQATDAWTMNLFVRTGEQPENRTIIAGFGTPKDHAGKGRFLSKFANGIHYWSASRDGETTTPLDLNRWQMLSAVYDGSHLTIFKNAELIGEKTIDLVSDESEVHIAPIDPWDKMRRFKGSIRDFTIWGRAISAEDLRELLKGMPK